MNDEYFMRIAMRTAQDGIENGEMPFGACLVDQRGVVLSVAHNNVATTTDPTAHAEIQAIRQGAAKLVSPDLRDCVMYATCEPCPMCFSACLWSHLSRIVYAACSEDGERFGIVSIPISCSHMCRLSRSDVKIIGDVLRDESVKLFAAWQAARSATLKEPHL